MEISRLDTFKFKVKGKSATVTFDLGQVSIDDFNIFGPGEYEVHEVAVLGAKSEDHQIFRVKIDKVTFLYPGLMSEKIKDQTLEDIDGVDVLFTSAAQIVSQIEPKLVIPFGEEEPVQKIIKDLGKDGTLKVPKLVTSADKLPDLLEVVWL
ncbi:hypothetical protein A2872_00330 [Candidatus Gottesmanbacteria bacterium RIFCSPHIGHO2_01_FULL_42_12]|uniref:Uncharacterized protein n=1 Tax=Candidatus Gottesmanbacteria bacterium RIFCSPHIGHO2_01_FULL_42_12 TaxID=1798377 RepID=A0A1F5Z380_9BACT|nr:MAG: hypothetical protein A2872_00330 [Candidatus Gottesmanbacteria bacterium RIFCSPHIGHO2_01_FULL_42_12]